MKSIQDELNKAVAGLDLTDEENNSLLGLYYIGINKTALELLAGIRGQQEHFHEKLDAFFSEVIATL